MSQQTDAAYEACQRALELARLHAAAPDLLSALRDIVACAKMAGPAGTTAYLISDSRMQAARDAISKAEGRSE